MAQSSKERRRHPRCEEAAGMIYTRLNGTSEHPVIARNYSRCGMYFESETALIPGTDIILRPMDCDTRHSPEADMPKPYFCSGTVPEESPCLELRFHTVATVLRSVPLDGPEDRPRHGIAVDYLNLDP